MPHVRMPDGTRVAFPVTLQDRYGQPFELLGFEPTIYGPRVYSQTGRTRMYHELGSFGLVLSEEKD